MSSRPKLLAILDRSPYPADDGVAYPMAGHLEGLAEHWDIDLLWIQAPHSPPPSSAVAHQLAQLFRNVFEVTHPARRSRLQRLCGEVFGGVPLAHYPAPKSQFFRELLEGRAYDAVYTAPMLAGLWAATVAEALPRRPLLVFNLNDSLSEKFRRFGDLARMPTLPAKSRLRHGLHSLRVAYMPRLERKMLGLFDLILVQTPRDRDAVAADCGPAIAERLLIASNGIKEELLELPYAAAGDKRLVHIGALVHNRRELLRWFVGQVYIPLQRELPGVSLELAGSLSAQDKTELEAIPGISAHGFVPRLEDVLQTATMSIAPMFMRTGIINKNLDSMAAGVPCSGIKAFNGIPGFQSGVHGFELRDADAWRRSLVEVLQNPPLLEKVSAAGRQLVADNCRWEATVSRIHQRMVSMIDAQHTS